MNPSICSWKCEIKVQWDELLSKITVIEWQLPTGVHQWKLLPSFSISRQKSLFFPGDKWWGGDCRDERFLKARRWSTDLSLKSSKSRDTYKFSGAQSLGILDWSAESRHTWGLLRCPGCFPVICVATGLSVEFGQGVSYMSPQNWGVLWRTGMSMLWCPKKRAPELELMCTLNFLVML